MPSGKKPRTVTNETESDGFELSRVKPMSAGPATTFDEMLGPASTPASELARKRSTLTRAATRVRKLVVGRTPEERSARVEKKQNAELNRLFAELALERGAQKREEELRKLRLRAVRTGFIDCESLRELAEAERVYLNPRPTRKSRFEGDDYTLADGLVARLPGRLDHGEYIFLGSNKGLYIGSHNLGRGAHRIPFAAEERYSEYRETARAYCQLCR